MGHHFGFLGVDWFVKKINNLKFNLKHNKMQKLKGSENLLQLWYIGPKIRKVYNIIETKLANVNLEW